jgi:hypothetical protein
MGQASLSDFDFCCDVLVFDCLKHFNLGLLISPSPRLISFSPREIGTFQLIMLKIFKWLKDKEEWFKQKF